MAIKSYIITNKRTGKALTLTQNNKLVQSDLVYSNSQIWCSSKITGEIKLMNKESQKNLDLVYGQTENGTLLHTWEDCSANSQIWQLKNSSKGFKKIANSLSNKVLDIVMLSDENDALVQLWDDIGGDNQEWKVTQYPVPKKPNSIKTKKKNVIEKKEISKKRVSNS